VRPAWIFAATSIAASAVAIWLYLDNRDLRARLAEHAVASAPSTASSDAPVTSSDTDRGGLAMAKPSGRPLAAGPIPTLPPPQEESSLERRQRRKAELAARFGRLDGETDEEYRARVMPMIATGLTVPRMRMSEARKEIEAKAGITPEQSKQLDAAFDKVYDQTLDYTNKAIADGTLSPYERNVSGWLEFAGGLGGIFADANGQIGQVLTPQQIQTITASGFDWAEYLGAQAPWEKLNPPPPPPPTR
jgi:hypothetical protein